MVRFLEPMESVSVKRLPSGAKGTFEIKFDGFRVELFVRRNRSFKPTPVAEIEFAEWTPDERLRHASFICLRHDKNARRVVRET